MTARRGEILSRHKRVPRLTFIRGGWRRRKLYEVANEVVGERGVCARWKCDVRSEILRLGNASINREKERIENFGQIWNLLSYLIHISSKKKKRTSNEQLFDSILKSLSPLLSRTREVYRKVGRGRGRWNEAKAADAGASRRRRHTPINTRPDVLQPPSPFFFLRSCQCELMASEFSRDF